VVAIFTTIDPTTCKLRDSSSDVRDKRAHLFRCTALKFDIDSLLDNLSRTEKEAILYWIAKKAEEAVLAQEKKDLLKYREDYQGKTDGKNLHFQALNGQFKITLMSPVTYAEV
jgi:hypothetical protein